MKHVHVTLEDDDFQVVKEFKGDRTWRDFLIDATVKEEMILSLKKEKRELQEKLREKHA